MKEFVFISDFDGTLTETDFYQIIIDKYLGARGQDIYYSWKRREIKDIDFLSEIFSAMDRSEDEIYEDIINIKLDEYFPYFIQNIKLSGGEFVVLSAGTSYYIEKLFNYKGIFDVKIISNKGVYKNRGIKLLPDKNSPYYSDIYGVDKLLAVTEYKKQYKKVYYAGDSEPDLKSAMSSDIIYATGQLVQLLENYNHKYVKFDSFKQIESDLKNRGVILV